MTTESNESQRDKTVRLALTSDVVADLSVSTGLPYEVLAAQVEARAQQIAPLMKALIRLRLALKDIRDAEVAFAEIVRMQVELQQRTENANARALEVREELFELLLAQLGIEGTVTR